MNAFGETLRSFVAIALGLALGACGTTGARAPVAERSSAEPPKAAARPSPKAVPVKGGESDWRPATYTVKKGDTLYSLALEFGHDYRELAEWNGIAEPYVIRVGQVLRLTPPGSEGAVPLKSAAPVEARPLPMPNVEAKPAAGTAPPLKTEPKAVREPYSEQALARLEKPAAPAEPPQTAKAQPAKTEIARSEPPVTTARPAADKGADKAAEDGAGDEAADPDRVEWIWPASGKIIASFGDGNGNKGLDIAGSLGQPVVAAAAGRVVHTGTTLRGYGKLIIIKHNKSYFSVYAHNSQILVKEGQNVVRGQKIAEMGDTDADRVKLHFEIRRLGKPVDPLKHLPNDRTS